MQPIARWQLAAVSLSLVGILSAYGCTTTTVVDDTQTDGAAGSSSGGTSGGSSGQTDTCTSLSVREYDGEEEVTWDLEEDGEGNFYTNVFWAELEQGTDGYVTVVVPPEVTAGSFDLSTEQDPETCTHCVFVDLDGKSYFQSGGTLIIDQDSQITDDLIDVTGSLSNVTLIEIDPETLAPIAGGACASITADLEVGFVFEEEPTDGGTD